MCRIKNESHKYNREQNPFLYVVWIKGIWGYKKKKKLWLWSRKYNDSHFSSGAITSVIKMFFSQQPFIQFIRTVKPNRAPQMQGIPFHNLSFVLSQQKYSIFHSVFIYFILYCSCLISKKKKLWGTCSKRAL